MSNPNQPQRTRRAAYSVTETARLCGLSRARFYDLIKGGVMPDPVYCVRTRRPMYTAELAALCVRVKESNTAIDGRYVIFYSRSSNAPASASSARPRPVLVRPASDLLMQEMLDTLRAMGVQQPEQGMTEAVRRRCPQGVREETFEVDLRAVFDALRCRDGA
jgi:hypothetical protein